MNTEKKLATSQVANGERYCPECNTQVSHDTGACPSCWETLYAAGRPSWLSSLLGYLWGVLMGGIALVVVKVVEFIGGFDNRTLEMAVFGVVAVGAWKTKKAQLAARRDLAVWKPIPSTSNLAQNAGPLPDPSREEKK